MNPYPNDIPHRSRSQQAEDRPEQEPPSNRKEQNHAEEPDAEDQLAAAARPAGVGVGAGEGAGAGGVTTGGQVTNFRPN